MTTALAHRNSLSSDIRRSDRSFGRSHCLRPEFTAALAARLRDGACLHLISPHGQGRRRTLDDLQALLDDCMQITRIDMRGQHYAAADYDALISRVVSAATPALLILHNFDERGRNKQEHDGSSPDPVAILKRIAGGNEITLLCVSAQPPAPDLPLDAKLIMLPPLTADQLLNELRRRSMPLPAAELSALACRLTHQAAPYSALNAAAPTPP